MVPVNIFQSEKIASNSSSPQLNATWDEMCIRDRTDEELRAIRDAGLELLYMGVETGSDKVLSMAVSYTHLDVYKRQSPPVKTQFGYHIIKLIEHMPARSAEFEEVYQEVKDNYFVIKQEEVYKSKKEELIKKYDVVLFE